MQWRIRKMVSKMDRNWRLVFYAHPTPPLYTAQLEFDRGDRA
jgi:hypothetical protein